MSKIANDTNARSDDLGRGSATRQEHFRGSSLLLIGRMVALMISFVFQILVVRYLAKEDYGAFAYAVSLVLLGSSFARVGVDKSLSRFVPIYQENGDFARMAGTIVLALISTAGVGVLLVLLVYGLRDLFTQHLVATELSASVFLILIVLAPVEGLDNLLEKLLAVFARPRALFWRRYVLGPGLKLTAVISTVIFGGGVFALAYAYLVARVAGVLVSAVILLHVLARNGLISHFRLQSLRPPVRKVYGFSLPLLATDVTYALRTTLVTFLLELLHGAVAVASYRAVVPMARLNLAVMDTFKLLFNPTAARLYARRDYSGLSDLYLINSAWIALLTFPVFAASFTMAAPLTVLLFGTRYSDSATILAVLSLGLFFNAVLGFNALLLRAYGKVRVIFMNDALSAIVAAVLSLLLISQLGALGGAMAASAVLVIRTALNQFAIWRAGLLRTAPRTCRNVFLSIIVAIAALVVVQWLFQPPAHVGAILAATASLVAIVLNLRVFDIANTFPELLRIAAFRKLLGWAQF